MIQNDKKKTEEVCFLLSEEAGSPLGDIIKPMCSCSNWNPLLVILTVSEKKSFVCVHEDEAIVKKKIRKTFFSKLKLKVPWENQLKEEQKKVLRAFF